MLSDRPWGIEGASPIRRLPPLSVTRWTTRRLNPIASRRVDASTEPYSAIGSKPAALGVHQQQHAALGVELLHHHLHRAMGQLAEIRQRVQQLADRLDQRPIAANHGGGRFGAQPMHLVRERALAAHGGPRAARTRRRRARATRLPGPVSPATRSSRDGRALEAAAMARSAGAGRASSPASAVSACCTPRPAGPVPARARPELRDQRGRVRRFVALDPLDRLPLARNAASPRSPRRSAAQRERELGRARHRTLDVVVAQRMVEQLTRDPSSGGSSREPVRTRSGTSPSRT